MRDCFHNVGLACPVRWKTKLNGNERLCACRLAIRNVNPICWPFTLSDSPEYLYQWMHGGFVRAELLDELAELYSSHYGIWGDRSLNRFQRIRLSSRRIQQGLVHKESRLAYASLEGKVIGYAIAVQPRISGMGVISWVTQLVVHSDHRRRDVGKRLLFSIWEFSGHFAWGLVTASPYAVRALEKATRRRCDPHRIAPNHKRLLSVGSTYIPYLNGRIDSFVDGANSRINTEFFIDHSELPFMLDDVVKPDAPWTLGEIPEGWEWLAFTFQDQSEIGLSEAGINRMLRTSDAVAKQAYSRMRLNASHRWARHTSAELALIMRECQLEAGATVLDIGCGTGRRVMELAKYSILRDRRRLLAGSRRKPNRGSTE